MRVIVDLDEFLWNKFYVSREHEYLDESDPIIEWTMDMTIDQQVAMDEALVPHARRLRIRRSNFRLLSGISSKESTLQLVYDVLRLTPFFKAFLFKMDNKKHIVKLESFREMLHICSRLPGQTFNEPPFEEEILAFLRSLRHSGEISRLTDRNVDFAYLLWEDFVYQIEHKDTKKRNEMYYPRFTKVIIHHFMSKDPSIPRRNKVNWHYVRDDHMFTTIKLVSRHQNTQQFGAILLIELTNVDIRNSDAYKEYYAVATGATPPKTKASVRKTKSSSDTTVTPPPTATAGTRLFTSAKQNKTAKADEELKKTGTGGDDVRESGGESEEEKETSEEEEVSFDPIPRTPEDSEKESDDEEEQESRLSEEARIREEEDAEELYRDVNINQGRGLQITQSIEDTHVILTPENVNKDDDEERDDEDDQEECSDDEQASNEEGEEFIHSSLSTHDEEETRDDESFDPISKTPENTNDEGSGEENLGMNVGREEGQDEEDEEDELYRDVNINLGRSSSVSSQFVTSMLNPTPDAGIESIFKTSSQMDVQPQTTVALLSLFVSTLTPSTIATTTTVQQAPTPPITALSTLLQDLPNFGSLFGFDHRLKTLQANFFEFMQANQFFGAVFSILEIVQRYMDQRMNEAVKVVVQIQSDRLRDEAQAENEEFLKTIDENMQKIINDQVKEQIKTSYAVVADLSKIELKKILIKKIEGNKSIHRSNEQRNLYKALVEAYEYDKIILDTYGDTVTLKRHHDDDADKDEEPSSGSDLGLRDEEKGRS
nr:hypothetical protein [Tanacetum cinerariifolium]